MTAAIAREASFQAYFNNISPVAKRRGAVRDGVAAVTRPATDENGGREAMAATNKALLLAPRRLGDTNGPDLLARYFPGLDVDLSALDFEGLSNALEAAGPQGLEDGAYSTVVVVESLEHSPEPARVLAAAARAVEEGGRILVSVPFAMPLHEAGTDYWRFTPDGLRDLIENAGLEDLEVFDTGEEVDWDVIPESPGLVRAWMPYPRICFATARMGAARDREPDGGDGARELKELLATDVTAMRTRLDDMIAALEASEEQARKNQARIRHLEEDNEAKQAEMDKLSDWARGMEAELLALKASGASEETEQPAAEEKSRRRRGTRKE